MSDRDLEDKFAGLAEDVLPDAQIRALIAMCWQVETLDDVSRLARMATPP